MPTTTYTPLANITLGSSASSVTFSNIPNTYRDLIVICDWAGSANANYLDLRLNGDSGSNYTGVFAYGASNGTGSFTTSGTALNIAITRTGRAPGIAQIMDYSATDKHKTVLSRYGLSDQSEVGMLAGRWANTAAVTTVLLRLNSGTISSGSTFALFGVIA